MKVLIVEPGQYPREAEIEKSLAAEQAIVGGLIECVYLWKDNACIVCNDEGKLQNLPFNRTLGDYDVIAGTFFVVGLTQDDFCSLTPEQVKRYEALYHDPQLFYPLGGLDLCGKLFAGTLSAGHEPRRAPRENASTQTNVNP